MYGGCLLCPLYPLLVIMNNLSAIFFVEFAQVQFIDLSEQVVKAAVIVTSVPGADPGFFLGGRALVSCSTSTPINHIVFFFLQNTSCTFIRKPQVIWGGGGCAPPAPSP